MPQLGDTLAPDPVDLIFPVNLAVLARHVLYTAARPIELRTWDLFGRLAWSWSPSPAIRSRLEAWEETTENRRLFARANGVVASKRWVILSVYLPAQGETQLFLLDSDGRFLGTAKLTSEARVLGMTGDWLLVLRDINGAEFVGYSVTQTTH